MGKPAFADLARKHTVLNGPRCRMGVFLAGLTPAERAEVEAVLVSSTPGRAIAKAANEWMDGDDQFLKLTGGNVQRHRNGDCACAKA